MGITFVDVKVTNPARPKKSAVHPLLVDSGATFSVIPASDLKRLGIKPVREKEFLLANGECVTMKLGDALFALAGDGHRFIHPDRCNTG